MNSSMDEALQALQSYHDYKNEQADDAIKNVLPKKWSLTSFSSSLSVNVGSSTPEKQTDSWSVHIQSKAITNASASAQVSPCVSPKPPIKESKRKHQEILSPTPNREKKQIAQNQRILPHNGKSSPALSTPRLKNVPSVHYTVSRRFVSKNVLEPAKPNVKNKIFEIHGSNAGNDLRKSLLRRGWIEKPIGKKSTTTVSRSRVSIAALYEATKAEIEMELKDYFPGFIWACGRVNWERTLDEQIINQIPTPMFAFTSKVGLVSCLQNSHWFQESGKTNARCPRCYRLSIAEERVAFVSDYLLTACISFVQYLVNAYEKDGAGAIMDPSGKVSPQQLNFALKHVKQYVRRRRHEDIDQDSTHDTMDDDWDVFLEHYNRLVFGKGRLSVNSKKDMIEEAKAKHQTAREGLDMVAPFWPQLNIDGFHNIWICKPGEMSRGKGIVIVNNITNILELFPHKNKAWMNTVVQKYIERPLLIYNTKFDIRQWFLISRWNPLTVWFYNESYLRFCSKPFSIDDLHERVHLCNHSVQSKYNIWKTRSVNLPDDNMWDSNMFQEFLAKEGNEDVWSTIIHPGMKEGILGVLLSSQDHFFSKNVVMRKNSFQLFGADFMVCDDFTPWLIEINSNPDMSKDTKVLKRLCSSCVEDMVKVVLDRRENPKAETGKFVMVYQEQEQNIPLKVGHKTGQACLDVCLRGERIRIPSQRILGTKSSRKVGHSKSTKSIDSSVSKAEKILNNIARIKSSKNSVSTRSRSRQSIKAETIIKHKRESSKSKKEGKSKSKSPSVESSKSRKLLEVSKVKQLLKNVMAQTQTSKTKVKRVPEQYKQYRSKSRGSKSSNNKPQGGQWKRKKDVEAPEEPKLKLSLVAIKPTIGTDLFKASKHPQLNENNNGAAVETENNNNNVTIWKNPNTFAKKDSPLEKEEEILKE